MALEAEEENMAVEAYVSKEEDSWILKPKPPDKSRRVAENVDLQRLDCIYDDEPLGFEKNPMAKEKMQPQDPLKEINLDEDGEKIPTYISANINKELKTKVIYLLKEFRDCFALDYNEIPGLSRDLVELKLPIKAGKKPVKQTPRRFALDVVSKIKAEIERLLKAKEDVPKTAIQCPGALGTYEWAVMPFGLKNAGETYQRVMNSMFRDFIEDFMHIYIDDMAGDFLGFVVQKKGIEVNQSKTKSIMDVKPPSTKKELQSLLGKISFLRRFISNLSGKKKVFSPLLRLKNEDFQWREEHQEAFDKTKEYLVKPPVLAPSIRNRPMRLYISASESTIGSMLVQEDEKSVERPVYYLSQMINGPETRYIDIEKLCLCLRIGKWALALTEYSLTYAPLKAIKGQVVADFLVDHSMVEMAQNYVDIVPWKLYFDGSSHKNGSGIGGIIISPVGIPAEFKYKIKGACTNNEAEYESLITGLELLLELGARNVEIMGDSELVIKQVSREYRCVKENLIMYFVITIRLLKRFEQVNIRHIPQKENQGANALAQEASGYKVLKDQDEEKIQVREKVRATLLSPSDLSTIKLGSVDNENFEIMTVDEIGGNDWRKPIVDYLRNPTGSTD
ncbi:uncharacterized protein LOC131648846 [Vicia villosa]|uniref:uncharacterized protein LOC131648846 n=1 Tax=Vicia villosa TaxID=3911 RepID=UPI00273B7FB3|nr:uncharacterized protein LOC131648846 [Vicia villosa]